MWIDAILTKDDLLDVFVQLAPLEIRLGESGTLLLSAPKSVSTVPDRGVAVVCDATLHFPVLGIDLPIHMHGLTVVIHPAVEDVASGVGQALVFTLEIDHTGVALLPHIFDERITKRVNEELVQKHFQLAWNFHDTLSHIFQLPNAMASVDSLGLKVSGGRVKVTSSALGFAVCFETHVTKRTAAA